MTKIMLYYPDIHECYSVIPTKDDYIEYLWEKETGVPYNPALYKYDDPEGKLYSKLESDWLHNAIDEHALSHDCDFINYLTSRYEDEVLENFNIQLEDECSMAEDLSSESHIDCPYSESHEEEDY